MGVLVHSSSVLFPTQQPSLLAALSGVKSMNMWIAVTPRFTQFQANLGLTPIQRQDGLTKRNGVVNCLNSHYYATLSDTANSFLIGSWGKDTAIRPPRDVDLYFVLPPSEYQRFQAYTWNRQSALLQEVKTILGATYPTTDMRGDGQVVVVRFETYCVEVVPAFQLQSGHYWICNTNNGGSYTETDPWAEVNCLEAADPANNRNLRPLIRMLKAWQSNCSVPLKSFQLELLATDFLSKSPWRLNSFFYYDWITRDFFEYLCHKANSFVMVPGTFEVIWLGSDWLSRAQTAYQRALKACEYEKLNLVSVAGDEWQKIFGQQIPRTV